MQFKFLSEKKNQIVNWFYSRLAKYNLIHKKRLDLAIFGMLESYLTEIVLAGGENRREELAEMQRKIQEVNNFVEFLKKI